MAGSVSSTTTYFSTHSSSSSVSSSSSTQTSTSHKTTVGPYTDQQWDGFGAEKIMELGKRIHIIPHQVSFENLMEETAKCATFTLERLYTLELDPLLELITESAKGVPIPAKIQLRDRIWSVLSSTLKAFNHEQLLKIRVVVNNLGYDEIFPPKKLDDDLLKHQFIGAIQKSSSISQTDEYGYVNASVSGSRKEHKNEEQGREGPGFPFALLLQKAPKPYQYGVSAYHLKAPSTQPPSTPDRNTKLE
jgi:hypothetical protein